MGSTFADSDFGDTVETQLTLGTVSLLGIFFGFVMVCGLFFGVGYSLGRRNGVSTASAAMAAPTHVAPVITWQIAPVQPDLPLASVTPPVLIQPALPAANEISIPTLSTAARTNPSANTPVLAAKSASVPVSPATSAAALAAAEHTLEQAKSHIPKPSAIQPAMEQTNAHIPLLRIAPGPQFTAQNLPSPYFVWTPPFDVKRHHGVTHRVYTAVSHPPAMPVSSASVSEQAPASAYPSTARVSMPHASAFGSALVVQIAALSRQDDAEVLASALRQRGFAPSIKSNAEDTLYHVQVGPFSRDVAFATRQRLIAKGYNAVLK